MVAKADLRVTIPDDLKRGLDALAKATGRTQGAIIEQALRLVLDPLPALARAQALLAAQERQATETADRIRVIADYIIDAHRQTEPIAEEG